MPGRARTGAAAWAACALLAGVFAWLLAWLSVSRLSPDLVPIAAAAAAWIGGLLFLAPLAVDNTRPLSAMALAAVLTGALTAAMLLVAFDSRLPLQTAIANALTLYLSAALVRLVARRRELRLAAGAWILFTLALASASAVWLGPLIDRLQPETAVLDALIAVNPLTHLAVLADVDYLRSDWFYRHSPFGGLRYEYPSPAAILAGYPIACVLASLAVRRADDRTRSASGGKPRFHKFTNASKRRSFDESD